MSRFECLLDPFQVRTEIVQSWRGHLNFKCAHGRVHLHLSCEAAELQTLIGNEGGFGDVNFDVALDLAATGKTLA